MTRLRTSNVYGLLGKFNCDAYALRSKSGYRVSQTADCLMQTVWFC